MGVETQGDLMITSGVDTSGIAEGLSETKGMLQSAIDWIKSAFSGAQESVSSFGDSLEGIGGAGAKFGSVAQAIIDKQAALEAKAESLKLAVAELQTGYEQGSVSADALKRAQDQLNAVMEKAHGSLHEAGQGAHEASEGMGELVTELLKMGGVILTLEGLKEAATEAFGAFAREQRAQESLTALMGSAKDAEASIERLKEQAQDQALSFPELLAAQQKMSAFGFSIKQSTELLEAAANAARATGGSFETIAMSIERMVAAGSAGGRQLAALGVTTHDLGDAMGVAGDQAAKMFKTLNEAARASVVQEMLSKFDGLAKQTANDLMGSWQQLKNTAEFTFTDIGKSLAPLASAFVQFAAEDIKEIGGIIQSLVSMGKTFTEQSEVAIAAISALAVATGTSALAIGVSLVQLGLAWRGLIDAEEDADKAGQKFADGLTNISAKARETFAGSSDFLAKLYALDREFSQGQISWQNYVKAIQQLNSQFYALHPELVKITEAHKSFAQQVDAIKEKYDAGKLSLAQYNAEILKLIKANSDATNEDKHRVLSLDELLVKNQEWTAEVDKAMAVVRQAAALDDSNANKKTLLAEAIHQLTKASKLYSDQVTNSNVIAIEDVATAQQRIDKANALNTTLVKLSNQFGSQALATQDARVALDAFLSSAGLLRSDLDRIKEGLDPIGPAFHALGITASETLSDLASTAGISFRAISQSGTASVGDIMAAWSKWQADLKKYQDSLSVVQSAAHQMGITTVADLQATRDKYIKLIDDMRASGEGGFDAIRAAMQKVRDLEDEITAALSPLTQAYRTLGIESARQMQIDLDRKKAALEMISGTVDYQRGLEAVQKAQDKLNEALGMTEKNAKGLVEVYNKWSDAVDKNGLVVSSWDTRLRASAGALYNQLNSLGLPIQNVGKGLVDAFGNGTSAVERLLTSLGKTVDKLNAIEQSLLKAAQRWDDFQKNLNIAGGIGDTSGGSTLGSISNPYWGKTPDQIQRELKDLMSSFAGSSPFSPGVRALYTAQSQLAQAAIQDFYKQNPFYDAAGNPPAGKSAGSRVASATPTSATPQLSPEVQSFLNQFADMASGAFVNIGGAMKRVADVVAEVTKANALPLELPAIQGLTAEVLEFAKENNLTQEQLAYLTAGLGTLNTTMADASKSISASFATLSPVIQQATTQIQQSIQQQAASFARLSDALAPTATPALPDLTKPGFMNLSPNVPQAFIAGGLVSGKTLYTVNNFTITDQNVQKQAQAFVDVLARGSYR